MDWHRWEARLPANQRGWWFIISREYVKEDLPDGRKHHLIIHQAKTWGWQGAVCRVMRRISYILTVGRRKTVPLNRSFHYGKLAHWYQAFRHRLLYVGRWWT